MTSWFAAPATPRQRVFAWIAIGISFAYLFLSASEPLRLNWGDPWSDANVLTALNYSSKYGFLGTSFIDVLDIGPLTEKSYRYTHYPPLAEIFYGTVRKIAGGKPLDISVYRYFAVFFSFGGLYAFYKYVSRLWGERLGLFSAVLCASNLFWLQFADSIHQAPILFLTGMTALAAVPSWALDSKRGSSLVIAIATFLCFLVAYDYYFFLPIAALLTARICGVALWSRRMVKLAALIAVSGLLSIILKSCFVSGALGFVGFREDFAFQFLERATTKFAPDYRTGFFIVLFGRWTSYFTPLSFIVAGILTVNLVRAARGLGLRGTMRAMLHDTTDLRSHAPTILVLLAAGVPFLLVFSELAVEQVLPSQVLIPFASVACAWAVLCLASRPRYEWSYVLLGALLAWQGVHCARVPKSFLSREEATRIRDYLRENDANDYLGTNLMADGQIQYYFERHLHPPWDRDGYLALRRRSTEDSMHFVYFEDENTRFVDKSLWPLLNVKSKWLALGYPYLFRETGLEAIREFDQRTLKELQASGIEVLRVGKVHVFKLGWNRADRRAERRKQLGEPVKYIDFGKPESDVYKFEGFLPRENYPGVPGFAWTTGHIYMRTVLTKRGVVYEDNVLPYYESRLLLPFDASHAQEVTLTVWGSVNDQTLRASVDGVEVLPQKNLGAGQSRQDVSFIVPKELLQKDPVKELVFRFGKLADFGGGVSFAVMKVTPKD